ncbi:MAG: four-carbon acid sugar kinase family protein [Eubacteriales bacterium]|nr:four-carbon acid sugar kinase family protein [Eubacteriales bacterium]
MIKLLIIADDFTGALDTGVQFSSAGLEVKVVTSREYDLADYKVDVLVLDSETRHLGSELAYKIVFDIVKKARAYGVPCIYKKTDSALRGNIGSELQALLDASGHKQLPFLPALPKMSRITQNGVHYIDGVPVQDSVFGQDPFEPVLHSYVPDIIRLGTQVKVTCVPEESEQAYFKDSDEADEPEILLYDATTDESLMSAAVKLKQEGKMAILAGCSGLAATLPELLDLKGKAPRAALEKKQSFLVACGSVNPITSNQLTYAERHGFKRQYLSAEQKLDPLYWRSQKGRVEKERLLGKVKQNRLFILDTNDFPEKNATQHYASTHKIKENELRRRITESLGDILANILDDGSSRSLMVVGGDTLMGFLSKIGVTEVEPVAEILPGTVVSRFQSKGRTHQIISKSGGFGDKELLVRLANITTGI